MCSMSRAGRPHQGRKDKSGTQIDQNKKKLNHDERLIRSGSKKKKTGSQRCVPNSGQCEQERAIPRRTGSNKRRAATAVGNWVWAGSAEGIKLLRWPYQSQKKKNQGLEVGWLHEKEGNCG